ncbi:carboxymuconolactone decarboxylase family protein [Microbaculum marinum]|uniref:Carboxymuconolactone decarboxylase family protein n=1 Tax=Microbaculum marinum TaxID=1764581 RepID=A0AAW9RF34_9HYPH
MAERPEFDTEQFARGERMRREVLGDAHVDASLNRADDFTADMQKLVTEWAWAGVWTRPGLDRKSRSIATLAMLTALNRPHELKAHVRGALRNGVSVDEVKEVLLQAAVYCGAPAALDAMRVAAEVLREERAIG